MSEELVDGILVGGKLRNFAILVVAYRSIVRCKSSMPGCQRDNGAMSGKKNFKRQPRGVALSKDSTCINLCGNYSDSCGLGSRSRPIARWAACQHSSRSLPQLRCLSGVVDDLRAELRPAEFRSDGVLLFRSGRSPLFH